MHYNVRKNEPLPCVKRKQCIYPIFPPTNSFSISISYSQSIKQFPLLLTLPCCFKVCQIDETRHLQRERVLAGLDRQAPEGLWMGGREYKSFRGGELITDYLIRLSVYHGHQCVEPLSLLYFSILVFQKKKNSSYSIHNNKVVILFENDDFQALTSGASFFYVHILLLLYFFELGKEQFLCSSLIYFSAPNVINLKANFGFVHWCQTFPDSPFEFQRRNPTTCRKF